MRKSLKIIAALAFFILAVCLGVVAAGASDAPNFRVGDVTTNSWDTAVELAKGEEIIYLNNDVSISSSLNIKSDTRLDLNGHTITDTRTNTNTANNSAVFQFASKTNVNFELLGEGTIKNCAMVITGGASENVQINAYGDGIRIERVATGSPGNPARIFNATQGSKWSVSGKIDVVPSGVVQCVFFVNAGTSEQTTDINIEGAEINVHAPTSDAWVHSTTQGQWFAYLQQYTKLTLEGSDVDVVHGNGIKFNYTGSVYTVEKNADYDVTTTEISESDIIEKDSWVTIKDSTLLVGNRGYSKAYAYSGIGSLFATDTVAAEVRCSNSTLMGAARSIAAKDNKGSSNLNPSHFYFNNVNYYTDERVLYGSPFAVAYNINMDWNGGAIYMRANASASKGNLIGSITLDQWKTAYKEIEGSDYTLTDLSKIDTAEELFGDIAKAAAEIAGFEITKEMEGDGYVASYDTYNKVLTYAKFAITTGNVFHDRTHQYTSVSVVDADGEKTGKSLWFGVRFANLSFFSTSGVPTQTNGAKGADSTLVGSFVKAPIFVVNGEAVQYACGYYDNYKTPTYPESGTVGRFTTGFNTVQSYSNNAAKVTVGGIYPINGEVFAGGHGGRHGTVYLTNALYGDEGYVKFAIASDEVPVSTTGAYFELKSTGYGAAKTLAAGDAGYAETALGYSATSAAYPLKDYKYFIQEFDIFTDTGKYVYTDTLYINRFVNPSYADGAFSSTITQLNSGAGSLFRIQNNGTMQVLGNNANGTYALPTDGTATRITLVLDVNYKVETYNLQTGADAYLNRRTGYRAGDTVMHIFANGTYLGYRSIVNDNVIMDATVFQSWGLDALRFESSHKNLETNKGGSLCFDNLTQSYYKASSAEAAAIEIALSKKSIDNPDVFGYYDSLKYKVDGVGYTTEDSALAAIKRGSTLELFADFNKPINVSSALEIITNGHNVSDIYSETHRVVVSHGNYYLISAKECDKVSVSFTNAELGIDTSAKFALGTNIYSPVDLSAYDLVTVGGKQTYLVDWSLKDGENYTTVAKGLTTAYPVYGAANVSWTDALGNVVAKETYRPGKGQYPKLPEGIAVETEVETNNGWYDLKVTGWTEALGTELAEHGDYVLSPDTVPVLFYTAKTVSDIKIGLTLYGYYEMNIYIPVYSQDERVSGVVLKDSYGNPVPIRYIDADNSVPTTIGGKEYIKYYVNIGVADTEARTFNLEYYVDSTHFSHTITYGVPYYASQIMADANQPEKAKTLVMNMVNYAVAVIDLMGSDEDLSIYNGLIERYSDGYFEEYDGLVDERFAAEDDASTGSVTNDIYNSLIKDLTYDDEDNKNAKFLDGASFVFSTYEPTFAFKYSDVAKQYGYSAEGEQTVIYGVKKPNSTNGINYHDVGVWIYASYYGGSNTYCLHYAYDKDGNAVKYNDANAWGNGGTSDDYDYYAFANNPYSAAYNSRNFRSVETITNLVSITVTRCSKLSSNGNAENANGGIFESGSVTYSLAAYYKGMLDLRAELQTKLLTETDATVVAKLEAELATCIKTIEATRALYAYSLVAQAY